MAVLSQRSCSRLSPALRQPRRHVAQTAPSARRLLRVRATQQQEKQEKDDKKGGKEEKMKRVQHVERSLVKMGVDRVVARRLLKVWQASGVTSPETLRRLFLQRSYGKSRQVAVQLAIDLAAAAGAFYAAKIITPEELGVWTLAAEYALYTLACYLSISASLDLFSLGAIAFAAFRYSTNADAFLLAVQDLAGSPSGLGLVDRAKQAVNIVKVLQSLDAILELLKGSAAAYDSFFQDLGAYLTLDRAQRLYGFDAARFGLSDAEAAEAAGVFAKYDLDDDGLLALEEFRRLCNENGAALSDEELPVAFEMLDTDKSGRVDLIEWCEWWVSKAKGRLPAK